MPPKEKPGRPGRPIQPEGPLDQSQRKDLCRWCGKRLKIGAMSIAQLQAGVMCPACAKKYGGKYAVCEPAVVG